MAGMNFSIEKGDMMRLLRDSSHVVAKSSPKPILTHLLLEVSKAGHELKITASDGEMIYSGKTACNPTESGAACVPAKDLLDLVKSLPDGVINAEMVADDDDPVSASPTLLATGNAQFLRLSAGRTRFELATLPAEDYPSPDWQADEASPATVGAGELIRVINETLYATSLEETRYYLGGCFFQVDDEAKEIKVVATDGHRLALTSLPLDTEAPALVVPLRNKSQGAIVGRRFLGALAKLLENNKATHVSGQVLEGRAVWFETADVMIQSPLIEGTFPDYRAVMPKDPQSGSSSVVLNAVQFAGALERVSKLSPDKSGGVRFVISSGEGSLHSRHVGRGRADVELDLVGLGGDQPHDLEVGYNAHYLLAAIKAMDASGVKLSYTNHLSPALLEPCDVTDGTLAESSSKHVVMPMRL